MREESDNCSRFFSVLHEDHVMAPKHNCFSASEIPLSGISNDSPQYDVVLRDAPLRINIKIFLLIRYLFAVWCLMNLPPTQQPNLNYDNVPPSSTTNMCSNSFLLYTLSTGTEIGLAECWGYISLNFFFYFTKPLQCDSTLMRPQVFMEM